MEVASRKPFDLSLLIAPLFRLWFSSLFLRVTVAVCLSHALILTFLWLDVHKEVPKKALQKVVVTTVTLQPKQVAPPKEKQKEMPSQVPPKKKVETKANTKEPVVPTQEKTAPKVDAKALRAAKEALDKSYQTDKESRTTVPSVPTIASLGVTQEESGYVSLLVTKLKWLLHLPELGDVEVEVTVNALGQVVHCAVLSSKSAINQKYIETTLPTLQLPKLQKELAKESQHTFHLVLTRS